MALQIGQRTDHGFDEPLGLLSDCHRRIEHFLQVLATIACDVAGGPLTSEYRGALEGSLRYFAVAAPKHTADEEASLFPRLRNCAEPAAAQALAALDRLEHEHDVAEVHHMVVDELGRRWLETGHLEPAETEELRERLVQLQALYRRHIAVEDQEVFPAAARALDCAQLQQIGGEMAARRHVRATVALIPPKSS